ncbi:hypothetical protein RI129_008262 [Pyrocoelia pectoralis]|uniref:Uncharacterized protein n=1 Tax=Pyrocoelia pectoralis TaxID=417401 RepID=A0AAN7ZDI5_9COLE
MNCTQRAIIIYSILMFIPILSIEMRCVSNQRELNKYNYIDNDNIENTVRSPKGDGTLRMFYVKFANAEEVTTENNLLINNMKFVPYISSAAIRTLSGGGLGK